MLRLAAQQPAAVLRGQHGLYDALRQLNASNDRLATMRRINQGRDDPAGLIALEKLRTELTALQEVTDATSRADAMLQVADSGMDQSGQLLRQIRANAIAAADSSTSDAERQALQLETDAALEALDRLGHTTSFAGRRLLDGGQMNVVVGSDPSQIEQVELPVVNTGQLGGADGRLHELRSGGSASLTNGGSARASEILDEAESQILNERARLGAFRKTTLDTARNAADRAIQNLSEAASQIGDTDVAVQSSLWARAMVQVDYATATLRAANHSRQLAARLLSP